MFTKGHKVNLGRKRKFSQVHKNNLSLSMKGRIPWNKGLDISDPRVMKNCTNRIISDEGREKIRNTHLGKKCNFYGKVNEQNINWRGEMASANSKHKWLISRYGKADHCSNPRCNGKSKIFDWSNKYHKYSRDIKDYQQLCRSCHTKYDLYVLNKNNSFKSVIKTKGICSIDEVVKILNNPSERV